MKKKKKSYTLTCQQNKENKKATKRIWALEWLKERCNAGIYQNLIGELRLQMKNILTVTFG